MKVLIIEDEKLASDRLIHQLRKTRYDIEILDCLRSVRESVQWLSGNRADLIFLDIQLSDGICFSIFEKVQVNTPVIFTTAYDQYAIEAFRLNSIDYLLKPVKKSDLEAALRKFEAMKQSLMVDVNELLSLFSERRKPYRERFLIRIGDVIKRVSADEVAYFFAKDKGVYLVTNQDKKFPMDDSLDSLENQLDPERFFRINRALLIHIDAIGNMLAWTRSRVKLELNPPAGRDVDTVVSTSRSADFKKWLDS